MSFRFKGSINLPPYDATVTSNTSITYNNVYQIWAIGGNNSQGVFGQSNVINRSSPIQIGITTPWTSSVGFYNSYGLAVKNDGTLWGWGSNLNGTLGLNNTGLGNYKSSPVQVGSDTTWLNSKISTGSRVLVLKSDKSLWGWGLNTSGELGLGNVISRSSPTQIGGINYPWTSFYTTGPTVSVGIKSNGSLWAWGQNNYGGLGQNDTIYRSSPTQVGVLTNWLSVAAGGYHVLATKTDGTLWAWGYNTNGELGFPVSASISTPTQVGLLTNWLKVAAGRYHSVAIKTDGTLWAWGQNNYGPLGLGDVISRSSPIQVGTDTNWYSIDCNNYYNTSAIKTDGSLWIWGINLSGELGLGDVIYRSSPVQVGTDTNWSAVSSGTLGQTLALRTNGTLWSWGKNNLGQLGTSDTIYRSSPTQIGSLTSWLKISCGYHSTAIKTDGTLWTWGYDPAGVAGDGTTTTRSSPVQVGYYNRNWTFKINGGGGHVLGTRSDGSLWAWGLNTYGQLGDSTVVSKSQPIQIGMTSNWSVSAIGLNHSLAIRSTGTLWAWGYNVYGQLGINNQTDKSSPTQVGTLTDWSSIAGGIYHSLSLKINGTLWTWGLNNAGQLGQGNTIAKSSPVQIGALTSWLKISASQYNSFAIKTDGTLWAWGHNVYGSLGLGDVISRSSPVQVGAAVTSLWAEIASNGASISVIKPNGTLWSWGSGNSGQTGFSDSISRSSPVQVGTDTNWLSIANITAPATAAIKTNGTLWTWGAALGIAQNIATNKSSPTQVGTDTNWASIVGNINFFALKTDGTLWDWGQNAGGGLGQNNTGPLTYRSSPTQVGLLTNWLAVYPGGNFSFARKTDGTFWAWGYNNQGYLGLGDKIDRSSPVQVSGATDWSVVLAAGQSGALIKTDGTLWTWGSNAQGQLGFTSVNRSSPIQVGVDTNWSQVYGKGTTILAIKTNGTLWGWGSNGSGQIGDSTIIYRSSPVQVGALTTWVKIFASDVTIIGLKSDNTIWSWGQNASGQLGLGNVIYRSSPVQIGILTDWTQQITSTEVTNWSNVSVGQYHVLATRTNGTLWAWGLNSGGQLGLNSTNIKLSPVQVGTLTNWSSVGITNAHSTAVKNDGTLWTWGDNTYGQTGDGTGVFRSSPVQVGLDTDWVTPSPSGIISAAIKTNGSLYVWGGNGSGQLGLNDVNSRFLPVKTASFESVGWSSVNKNYKGIAAIKTNGNLLLMGLNAQGQLGDNTVVTKSSPVQVGDYANWVNIYGSDAVSFGIKENGTLWSWGINTTGRLGDGTVISKSSPIQIGSDTNWSTLSIWIGSGSVLAIKTDGTLWGWGYNGNGELGDNTAINRSSPVQIGNLYNWSKVLNSSHDYATLAIKTDGTLWSWGYNSIGQLGQNDIVARSSPVQVGALNNWVSLSSGISAIKSNGTLWVWGSSADQLGLGDNITRSSPVQLGLLNTWVAVPSVISGATFGLIY